MSPPLESQASTPSLSELVERCTSLCDSVTASMRAEHTGAADFLKSNIADTLQQLELLLHVLDRESRDNETDAPVLGFLERFFRRADSPQGSQDAEAGLVSFDFAKQGLQGSSWTIPISELLSFLASQRKTGILWVDSLEENFAIGLEEGQLIHASGSQTPEGSRLGETLVGMGCLTRRQLDRFLEAHYKDPSQVFGEMLLGSGIISEEELGAALTQQFQQTFLRLVYTKNAVFRFREGLDVAIGFKVQLSVNQLLLDSARASDEAGNPDLREAALADAWEHWQAGITARIAELEEEEDDDDEDDDFDDIPDAGGDEVPDASVTEESVSEAPEVDDTAEEPEKPTRKKSRRSESSEGND